MGELKLSPDKSMEVNVEQEKVIKLILQNLLILQ